MDDISSTSGVIASMEAISLEEMDAVKNNMPSTTL